MDITRILLSRVYNFLVENEKIPAHDIDCATISLHDVPMLSVKFLPHLFTWGFNKMPLTYRDFELYGSTETGIKFLEMILEGQYVNERKETWREWKMWKQWPNYTHDKGYHEERFTTWEEAWSFALSKIELKTLDIKAFKLISRHLGELADSKNPGINDNVKNSIRERRKYFYKSCMKIAIEKGDFKFLNIAIPDLNSTVDEDLSFVSIFVKGEHRLANAIISQVAKGNISVFDYIFDFSPDSVHGDLREALLFGANLCTHCSPPYVPFLKHLFKKYEKRNLPLCKSLADYARSHLSRAIARRDSDHYNEVYRVDGVMKAMRVHNVDIPVFPQWR